MRGLQAMHIAHLASGVRFDDEYLAPERQTRVVELRSEVAHLARQHPGARIEAILPLTPTSNPASHPSSHTTHSIIRLAQQIITTGYGWMDG